MTKRKNKSYPIEFKQEAVALVTEQGYSGVKQTRHPSGVKQTRHPS